MEKKISGTEVSKILYEELREYLLTKEKMPRIVDISIGDDFGGKMYAQMKEKKIKAQTGIYFESIHLGADGKRLRSLLQVMSNYPAIHGIMLQLPLPQPLNQQEREILEMIPTAKDVDGLTYQSAGLLSVGQPCFVPCTALGIEVLLKVYGVELTGKKIAIINRSNIVGKPLMQLLLKDNALPIVCHSKVQDLASITRECDIVVAALNKREMINVDYIKEGAVVIDVGVHKNEEGKTVGDVDYSSVYDKVSLITPPIGGVGPMTVCMLAYNSAKAMYHEEVEEVLATGMEKAKQLVLR